MLSCYSSYVQYKHNKSAEEWISVLQVLYTVLQVLYTRTCCEVVAPRVAAPRVAAPRVAAPRVAAPQVAAPRVAAPRVVALTVIVLKLSCMRPLLHDCIVNYASMMDNPALHCKKRNFFDALCHLTIRAVRSQSSRSPYKQCRLRHTVEEPVSNPTFIFEHYYGS
jgi:hypothetical protein